jgi:hypothetical protein
MTGATESTVESSSLGPTDGEPDPAPRSVGEIVNDLWLKAETLIRQEMQLGLADAQDRVDVLKRDLLSQVAQLRVEIAAQLLAGLVLFAGMLALAAAVILLLARAVSPWIAAAIVGVAITGAGVALLYRAGLLPSASQTRASTFKDTHTNHARP